MNEEQRNNITLETVATILGGSFLFNLVILLLWFMIVLFAPAWYYAITEKWFAITRHESDLINYSGIAFMKIINIVFFLCPYVSIKFCLRKKKLQY
jgi:heme/copper-type cytochrome/quinol oxidase subunit 2